MTDDRPAALPRFAAALEVVGVLIVGSVLANLVMGALGAADSDELQSAMLAGEAGRDFLLLARVTLVDLLVKYGCLLGLAFAIGWWHRRRGRRAYGVTRGGWPVGRLVLIGIATFGIGGLLPRGLVLLSRYLPIGEGPEHWALFPDTLTLPFLLWMLVGSFGLVPIVEELFIRGYMQTRLSEDFGPAAGISLVALIFALAHTQYFKLEVLSLGMLVSIALLSWVVGWAFHRTGSLLPGIVGHALLNFPFLGRAEMVAVAGMAAICAAALPRLWGELPRIRRAVGEIRGWDSLLWAVLLTLAVLGAVLLGTAGLAVPAAGLVVALMLEAREKRSGATRPRSS